MKNIYLIFSFFIISSLMQPLWAGNPDRQGEAGAYELLMNPWARSAGLHSMTTASITGVEALRLNPAGLARINQTEILISHALYLRGTDIAMNALGFSQRMGKNSAFGLSLMALDFGDIPVTTTNNPEGIGITFSPSFFNLGLGYAHIFENKVSVGMTLRVISESTADISAFGFALDAGVQYVTGPQDNFKFGISLRNVGTPMSYKGEGLAVQRPNPDGSGNYPLTYETRAATFELPSVLNIGASYDILFGGKNRITLVGNFTSNSFSQDQIGGGLEYGFNEILQLRAGYKIDFGSFAQGSEQAPIYSGLSAGASINVPLGKDNPNQFGIEYAYRQTNLFDGTHNISVKINLGKRK